MLNLPQKRYKYVTEILRPKNYAMATVCAKVFKHHRKADGTYNVKIRIYHKGELKFIETKFFVSEKQLSKKLTIKDPFVNSSLNKTLDEYRIEIGKLGSRLEFFSAEDLKNYLEDNNQEIDFIKFCNEHIRQLKGEQREGTASNHSTVRNSLIDFFRRESVSVMEINGLSIKSFERYLRGKREITRINQGKPVTRVMEGLSDKGIHNLMRDLRTLFNEARKRYNNEDLGIIKIPHYPFRKYKLPRKPETRKRNHTVEQIRIIRDCVLKPDSRVELARDLYMLSFYLCGMNAVDLYKLEDYRGNRIDYWRSKTKTVRSDGAFISIRIPSEAKKLLDKYIGKLKFRYANFRNLDRALGIGSKELEKITGISEISFYWARGSFANIARNKCKISKDDVALAMNHVDAGNKVTDIYIEKDWAIIDEVQETVLKFLLKTSSKKDIENKLK